MTSIGTIDSPRDTTTYPVEYRVGVLRGLLMTAGGNIGLTVGVVQQFVGLVESLPPTRANEELEELTSEVGGASWIETWRGTTVVDANKVLDALHARRDRFPPPVLDAYERFCGALANAARPADGDEGR